MRCRERKKWVTRARRVGEWHRRKEKAEERASRTCKHYISREEGGRTKGKREKKWRSKHERE